MRHPTRCVSRRRLRARAPLEGAFEPAASTTPVDLPLFDAPVPGIDDTPLLTSPTRPRAPLAVRRSTDLPRATPAEPGAEPPRVAVEAFHSVHRLPRAEESSAAAKDTGDTGPSPAGALPRLTAALVDLLILGGIDGAVLYFTLALAGLDFANVTVLPLIPLAAFLLLLDGGYLVGFTTASGQTIGKMMTGIRVVGEHTRRVPLGHAVVRAAAMMLTFLSVGVGYLPVLTGGDRRALHDRMARTRVVRR